MSLNDQPDAQFDQITQALKGAAGVSQARMFGSLGLKVDGRVFVMVVNGQLVAKHPKARVDALVSDNRIGRFDPGHGRVMKEWISIPHGVLPWLDVAREAYECVKRGK